MPFGTSSTTASACSTKDEDDAYARGLSDGLVLAGSVVAVFSFLVAMATPLLQDAVRQRLHPWATPLSRIVGCKAFDPRFNNGRARCLSEVVSRVASLFDSQTERRRSKQ